MSLGIGADPDSRSELFSESEPAHLAGSLALSAARRDRRGRPADHPARAATAHGWMIWAAPATRTREAAIVGSALADAAPGVWL